jgi:hypothetical protein
MDLPCRTLRELAAEFLVIESETTWRHVDSIDDADGVIFVCPKCFEDPPVGLEGAHSIICWQPHVGQEHRPGPGRWALIGTGIDDLSLVAGSSSVQLTGGCAAHFFVRNGCIAWR